MNIKDEIVDYLKVKLNENTQGELFNVGVDIKKAEDRYRFLSRPTYYEEDVIEYIPAMIDMEETPVGNLAQDKSDWKVTVQFALTGRDDADANLILERDAIEEFRLELRTNPVTFFLVDGIQYDVRFKPTHAVRIGETKDQAGNDIILYAMSITIRSGRGLSFIAKYELEKTEGNATDFSKVEILVDTADNGGSVEYNTSQNDTDDQAEGVPNRGLLQITMKYTHDDNLLAHRFLFDLSLLAEPFDSIMTLYVTKPNTGEVPIQVNAQVQSLYTDGLEWSMVATFTKAKV